jgi:hypothetical protein
VRFGANVHEDLAKRLLFRLHEYLVDVFSGKASRARASFARELDDYAPF